MLDVFGLDDNFPSASQKMSNAPHKPLSCPITVLCNDVQVVMGKLNYAFHRGDVYKMAAKSQFTYQYLCTMKTFLTFLHSLMRNDEIASSSILNVSYLYLVRQKAPLCHKLWPTETRLKSKADGSGAFPVGSSSKGLSLNLR